MRVDLSPAELTAEQEPAPSLVQARFVLDERPEATAKTKPEKALPPSAVSEETLSQPEIEEHECVWHYGDLTVKIGITFKPNDIAGHDHLEIRSIEPENHPLPITGTGYKSHFAAHGLIAEAGGPVAATLSWLDDKAQGKEWKATAEKIAAKRRQPSLLFSEPSPSPSVPKIPTQSSGLRSKAKATIDALYQLRVLEMADRPATDEEKTILAGFTGFGPLANHIFPEPGTDNYKPGWRGLGDELASLLTEAEYASAKRSTFSAFYTSPLVMQTIYDALAQMGVPQDAHVLEPGCGIGNFIRLAPEGMTFTGIEQETLSGRIAQKLYPEASIRIEPFQKSNLPSGSVDVVVGNVPFSDLTLKWQDRKLPLHDYFFAKSLDCLHDGGIQALVTSRYTLDKKDSTFRAYLAEQADFLGAIRLPKGAFRQQGTEVVTDIIFLQKREREQEPNHAADWNDTQPLPGFEAPCNAYFLAHPEMVIGELTQAQGMYRDHELTVTYPHDYETRLKQALSHLPAGVYSAPTQDPLTTISKAESQKQSAEPAQPLPQSLLPGSLFLGKDGFVCQVTEQSGASEPFQRGDKPIHSVSGTVGPRLAGLVAIRDAARAVLATQREERPEEERDAARNHLNRVYDRFVGRYGPINKTHISETANGTAVRRQPNLVGFKDDPDCYLVMALEDYDEEQGTVTKMPIMKQDVIGPTPPVDRVESALDGLLVCLNECGGVDLARISQLYDATTEQVIEELGSHIYYDPAQNRYVTAEEYLSGNVREKLRLAQEQKDDPRVAASIPALEAAQPAPVPPGDIDVQLGAAWIPAEVVRDFVADLLACEASDITVRHIEREALWHVDAAPFVKFKIESTSTYGTAERPALTLIHDALNMRVPTVTRTVSVDGKERQVPDQEATLAAREKQNAIKGRFQEWLFADPERGDQLTEHYNQQFNTTRLRSYDGSHLTFPGMNPAISLHDHQKDAVWRVMSTNNNLLAHVVGAGKTFEMVASGMKMKQAGLVRKPLYAVPNHMLEQFSHEFYLLYPDAKLLVASKDDLKKEKRKLFTAKAASGEWDGIIMTHSSFERIGMSPDFQEEFVREQIEAYERLLLDMKGDSDSKRLIKRIEKQKEQWEDRLETLMNLDRKDVGLTFEDLGVDHLFVDEAHLFKNLETPTKMDRVAGVQTQGSLRAFDLFMKSRYLDQYGHGTSFATGTPISNSMVEMYTMSRFLAPELLEERGISHFDGWASNFGEIVDSIELSPDAKSLRQHRRFAKFVNLPELLQIFHSFADVKTADMLELPTPDIKNGQATIIATPMSDYQQRIQESLVSRYERIRTGSVDPRDDNALKITTDGRKLALDARLVLSHLPDYEGKLDALATQVTEIWAQTREQKATQMIFCDLGVSNKNGQFSAYDAIIRKLVESGIPTQAIANIGDYKTDAKKAQLFKQVRSGEIAVLLGSTSKMGTGTNVQERLYALHHVDAPWKPAEVEQREGRILRQGNQNEEVAIYRYVTEGSFDAYMWQTLQTKAEFINQIMKGDMSIRRIEDMDEQALSYAEVKAIASGNPAVLTLAKMDMEVQKLSQLARAHQNEQYRLRQQLRQIEDGDLPMLARRQERIAEDIATIEKHGGKENPTLRLHGQTNTDLKKAQERLRSTLEQQWDQLGFRLDHAMKGTQERVRIGTFGGLDIELVLEKGQERISGRLGLKGASQVSRSLRGPGSDRLLSYLHELADMLPERQQETTEERDAAATQRAALETRLGLPFTQQARLDQLQAMKSELQSLLQSEAPTHSDVEDASVEESEQAEDNAPSQPTEQEKAERVQALVTAFDDLMKHNSSDREGRESGVDTDGPPADTATDIPVSPCPTPRWTDRLQSANSDAGQPSLLEVA